MNLQAIGHTMQYEAEQIVLLFFPSHDAVSLQSTLSETKDMLLVTSVATVGDKTISHTERMEKDLCRTKRDRGNLIKRSAYYALSPLSDMPSPWGILTGVRPAKLINCYMEEGMSEAEIHALLRDTYLVDEEKIELAMAVAKYEKQFTPKRDEVCVYIGIPFCPTRCSYCSFIAGAGTPIDHETYVNLLCKEIQKTAEIIQHLNLRLRAIYIGGGTPTSLSPALLEKLLSHTCHVLAVPKGLEWTVEAGRPDTIIEEKLQVLKQNGITRISINPQTLHDDTLRLIGRRHTREDFFRAFQLARQMGFHDINTDLIAGLPGEDFPMFQSTLDEIRALRPESLTIHTLYLKRASTMRKSGALPQPKDAAAMLSYARRIAAADGYLPYYMYRQKATVGNLENVGYALPGYSSFYNTVTMTDCTHLFALGAGGVSRLLLPDKMVRVFNYKYDDAYVHNFDHVLRRKEEYLKIASK
ncbi:MAG: coproporphyrinogen dehydrogenase HemZ [Clostridia bacterium]|nr:coproporphyrinogen dehydrogenase HemZ [Clostridia bacterium]